MSTPAQILANRTNSLRSTGPRTDEGKSASKLNSLSHGLASKQLVLPHESLEEFQALHKAFAHDYKPANETERHLVGRMADAWWRLQRALRVETALFAKCMEGESGDEALAGLFLEPKEQARLRLFMRYLASAERAWNKALADFNQARRERIKQEKSDSRMSIERRWADSLDDADTVSAPAIGFAPQSSTAAASAAPIEPSTASLLR
jgi:hypothetical protein